MKVVILGGYGVFGSRLARLLVSHGHAVVIVGRRVDPAKALADELTCDWACIDSNAPDLNATLRALSPNAVVDAAGPFQSYKTAPYKSAQAAISIGAHYLDLSDDAAFTKGITTLDEAAQKAGVCVLSGVSSVPALSSAAVAELVKEIDDVQVIDTAICPGNRAPRGRSVMAAILGQVGEPLRVWRSNRWHSATGWSEAKTVVLGDGVKRRTNLIGAPDLVLFPEAFKARSVLFRAGLELSVMHRALQVMNVLRRSRLMPPPVRFLAPLHWCAERLERLGSDVGGMRVSVQGRANGAPVDHAFTCLAKGGVGPNIPAIPALVTIEALSKGEIEFGARAALAEVPLDALRDALHAIGVETVIERQAAPRVFEQALGARWATMPSEWHALHDVWDIAEFEGRADVTRGTSMLSKIVAVPFGFPPEERDVALTVTMTRKGLCEHWTRNFNGRTFSSVLKYAAPDQVYERFGPFTFKLLLGGSSDHMSMQVKQGWLFGLPLPRWFLPRSIVREDVQNGRFCFDVELSLPIVGRLVRYRGWLAKRTNGS